MRVIERFPVVSVFRCLLLALAVQLLFTVPDGHGAMLYKDYVVRYDRGWDILCDPYQVQRGDWVLKIFRQKGEIAHEDFREFLGIFQRLNPHVKDIDRIRPGQVVDIPLKKLTQGTLPGQSSGMVTIPFVMINNPKEMIKKSTRTYTVKRGDTVSKLIANRFGGRYGNLTYRQGIELFKSANPHIKDIDRIYAGQKIYMPDPSIREKNWYSNLFDKDGNLVEKMPEAAASEAAEKPRPAAAAAQRPPVAQPEDAGPAGEAASIIGGRLLNKGTYFFPMKQGRDFELDLSRYPMIDMGNGSKVVLTSQDKVMNVDLPLIQSYWEDVKVVKVSENASSREIIEAVFAALSDATATNQLSFEDGAVTIRINAKWIRTETSADGQVPRHTCITPIANPSQQTHDAIVRYLNQNDIILNELISDAGRTQPQHFPVNAPDDAGTIDGSSQKTLIASFAASMGFRYSPNTGISFPYAGIQVQAQSNLLSFGNGREVLVDFGDLYGDAVEAIRKTGLEILQIPVDAGTVEIIQHVMDAAGTAHTAGPVFYGAERPAEFNTAITIDGILIPMNNGENRLFAERPIPQLIEMFLRDRGIRPFRIQGKAQ
ncbi:LysM peptidoglycan-binding domain-containing protein [uncultured Desulfosarcina sp.]|uniref:LysM peptidoglycan-binding domain-containing protein n=1 Tax=uncultured Desulfosarcina sp. TaxID=218289 RepID=UPI0029C86E60|nr:LysM peptidoglycan-binding domain-containing protein [uncultured Desulfosarcina sp.]